MEKSKPNSLVQYAKDTVFTAFAILCIAAFYGALNKHIFVPLWNVLDLDESVPLTIMVLVASGCLVYEGYCSRYKVIAENHKRVYMFAILLYVYVRVFTNWSLISLYGYVDLWMVLLVALPFGYGIGKVWQEVMRMYKEKKQKKENKPSYFAFPPITIISDDPIGEREEDLFGYNRFAGRIASSIGCSNRKASYSIGITAPWGSGKTSALNLLRKHLEQNKDIILVDFNPRESANVENIQSDFLATVCQRLKPYHSGASSVVQKYMKDLRVVADDTIWSKVIDLVPVNDIKESRDAIESLIWATKKRLVVIIDDLDRLTADEILEVLKLIDKNASFEKSFFVTAYDKEYVNKLLKKYLCDEITRDYTDKYFNLELRLPDRKGIHLNSLLLSLLNEQRSKNAIHFTEQEITDATGAVVGFIESCLPTARDVKRYVGQMVASLREVENEIVLRDFMLVSLIKYCYPQEYQDLSRMKYFKPSAQLSFKVTNYAVEKEKLSDKVKSSEILKLLLPENEKYARDDKNFGYKHLSWRRSFDFYFFDLEIGHLSYGQLSPLFNADNTLADFEDICSQWKSDDLLRDVADFVIDRQNTVAYIDSFKEYFRTLVAVRYYCGITELKSELKSFFDSENVKRNSKRFRLSETEYTEALKTFLRESEDWQLVSIVLRDVIASMLNPDIDLSSFISYKDLQEIAYLRFQNARDAVYKGLAKSDDVYELLKANICDADPTGVKLSKVALEEMKKAMINQPAVYLENLLRHDPLPNRSTGIEMYVNEHFPIDAIFPSGTALSFFCKRISDTHLSEEDRMLSDKALSCLSEFMDYRSNGIAKLSTRMQNKDIKQGDYETYIHIFEGNDN